MKEPATLSKRRLKSGREVYEIRWWDGGRRRSESLGHGDQRRAERVLAERIREIERRTVQPPMTLPEFIDASLKAARHQVRPATIALIVDSGKRLMEFLGGSGAPDITVADVSFSDAEQFVQSCIDRGNKPATANRHVRHLKRLWRLAIQRGWLSENPWRDLRPRKVPTNDWHWYTPQDVRRLISAASTPHWEARVLWAYTSGLRRGEVLNLTWPDVDFEEGLVHISPKEDTAEVWEWFPKDTDRRTVALTEEVGNLLADLQSSQPERHPYVTLCPQRYELIQTYRQEGRVRWAVEIVNNFSRDFRRITKAARIPAKATFHDLRRSCISNWLDRGVRPHEVRQLAGHASIQTTERYYIKVDRSAVDRAREAASRDSLRPLRRISDARPQKATYDREN